MKVGELAGASLDYWVAKAEGISVRPMMNHSNGTVDHFITDDQSFGNVKYSPSTSWGQGGPIIERERIGIKHSHLAGFESMDWEANIGRRQFEWDANYDEPVKPDFDGYGPTPLVAAMRAYVASKFGNEVPND